MTKIKKLNIYNIGRQYFADLNKTFFFGLAFSFLYLLFCFSYCSIATNSNKYLFLCAVLCIIPFALFFSIKLISKFKSLNLPALCAIFISIEGLIFLFIFTPFSVPDEIHHYLNAYAVANNLLLLQNPEGGLILRGCDIALVDSHKELLNVSTSSYQWVLEKFELVSNGNAGLLSTYISDNIRIEPWQERLPAAISIVLSRLIGLGAIPTFYLGRFFNLAFFVACSYWSIKNMPYGKNILAVICLLPMTLHVAASYSYDAFINGISFCLISACLKSANKQTKITRSELITIGILTLLLAPCKSVYLTIAFIVFFIPNGRFNSKKDAYAYKITIILQGLAAIFIMQLSIMLSTAEVARELDSFDIRGLESGKFYTISDILTNPLGFIKLIILTIQTKFTLYIEYCLGLSLGYFQQNITAPGAYMIAYIVVLFLGSIRYSQEHHIITFREKFLMIVITISGGFLIALAMYTGHTFNTEPIIMGIQGRYFLPYLPLIMLCCYCKNITINKDYCFGLMFAMVVITSGYLSTEVIAAIAQ